MLSMVREYILFLCIRSIVFCSICRILFDYRIGCISDSSDIPSGAQNNSEMAVPCSRCYQDFFRKSSPSEVTTFPFYVVAADSFDEGPPAVGLAPVGKLTMVLSNCIYVHEGQ